MKCLIVCFLVAFASYLVYLQTIVFRLDLEKETMIEESKKLVFNSTIERMLNKLVATCEKDQTNCYMNIGRFAGSLDYDPGVINIPVRAWRQALDYLLKDLLKCSDSTCVERFKKENSFHLSVVSVHLAAKFSDDLHDLQRQYWACLAYF